MISLRPVSAHGTVRRMVHAQGGTLLALSPWRLVDRNAAADISALQLAVQAPCVIATSPAAVRAAARLQPLRALPGQAWLAVGSGTARALQRAGIPAVHSPARMDSEGLLAMAQLQACEGRDIGVLTAPDGRDALLPALRARGARILRADVYARVPMQPAARVVQRIRALPAPPYLLLSSGQALQHVIDALPVGVGAVLRAGVVVAASDRLGELATTLGFAHVLRATDATARSLVDAAAQDAARRASRHVG